MKMTLEQMASELQDIIDSERPRLNKTEMIDYIKDLRAHLAAMGKPVVWMVGNDGEGTPGFVTAEPRVPWNYQVPLYAAPPPVQHAEAKDAARYRWLRDTPWLGTSLEPVITQQRNAHWDAAIDAAMAQESQP